MSGVGRFTARDTREHLPCKAARIIAWMIGASHDMLQSQMRPSHVVAGLLRPFDLLLRGRTAIGKRVAKEFEHADCSKEESILAAVVWCRIAILTAICTLKSGRRPHLKVRTICPPIQITNPRLVISRTPHNNSSRLPSIQQINQKLVYRILLPASEPLKSALPARHRIAT